MPNESPNSVPKTRVLEVTFLVVFCHRRPWELKGLFILLQELPGHAHAVILDSFFYSFFLDLRCLDLRGAASLCFALRRLAKHCLALLGVA